MSGYPGDLSPKQQAALDQFKERLQDVLKPQHTDWYLLRWLRARYFDVAKAEKMLRDHLKWYTENNVADLLNWEAPEVLRKYYPGGYFGEDKEGYPILYELPYLGDIKAFHYVATHKDVVNYKMYITEHGEKQIFPEQSKKHGRIIDQNVVILDLHGLSPKMITKPHFDIWSDVMKLLEANYPERMRKILVIRAPRIFPFCYNLMKPLVSPDTRQKIKVLGSNWKEMLQTEIDADQLPVHWGGTATDPDGDPCCRSHICTGGKIPESYYVLNSIKKNAKDFTKIVVGKGSSHKVSVDVQHPNSLIKWTFWSESYDIGFGVVRGPDAIVPSKRVESHLIPEEGCITCDDPGTYDIVFDNSYSWLHPKEINYSVEVFHTEEDQITFL